MPITTSGDFWSFLDSYLADIADSNSSGESQARPATAEKRQRDDEVSAETVPMQTIATMTTATVSWSLDPVAAAVVKTAAVPQKRPISVAEDPSEGTSLTAASAAAPASLLQLPPAAGLIDWNLLPPGIDSRLPADLPGPDFLKGTQQPVQVFGATPELAFTARLVPAEPAASLAAAEIRSSPAPGTGSVSPGPGSDAGMFLAQPARPELASAARLIAPSPSLAAPDQISAGPGQEPELWIPARDSDVDATPQSQPRVVSSHRDALLTEQGPGMPAIARGPHPGLIENEPVAAPTTETGENAHGTSSDAAQDQSSASDPEPIDTNLAVTTTVRNVALSMPRPVDERDGQAPAQHSDAPWSVVTPAPAQRESGVSSSGPAQPAPASVPDTTEPPSQPASHDVSLHLADGRGGVDIRMAERAGEIRVTVHTPDRDLANSLRADLPDLVGKLRQNGYQAEAWRPAAAAQANAGHGGSSDTSSHQDSAFAGREGRQQQPRQQPKNQSRWAGEWNLNLDPLKESDI